MGDLLFIKAVKYVVQVCPHQGGGQLSLFIPEMAWACNPPVVPIFS